MWCMPCSIWVSLNPSYRLSSREVPPKKILYMTSNTVMNLGESPMWWVQRRFCLSVCTYIHIPYIVVFWLNANACASQNFPSIMNVMSDKGQKREIRLQVRQELERQLVANVTAQQREIRLSRLRELDRTRRQQQWGAWKTSFRDRGAMKGRAAKNGECMFIVLPTK